MPTPPIAVDIDGTLTRSSGMGIDPRVLDPLAEWPSPVVIATGKSFPYPVALCQFIGTPERVIAENGGIVYVDKETIKLGDDNAVTALEEEYRAAGYQFGWEGADTVNRWRETELAVARSQPLEPLTELANKHGLEVVDSQYAYHVKDPDISKGAALKRAAELLDRSVSEFVAIGDSANDVSMFEAVDTGIAVGNAADVAKKAADYVLDKEYATGTVAALQQIKAGTLQGSTDCE